ncbi:hypothetical protein [Streptomyces bobili]|uniref:hypothetical protein n=1 Tax=Streptomyces bobili TaxID=67280 RepID=UPI0037874505
MDTPQSRQQSPPGAVTAFARFALLGGGVGITSGFAVAALAAWIPWVLANALITVASTLLATELHARFTFGVGRPATRRQHAQSARSAAAAYTLTCVAMLVLQQLVAAPGALLQHAVYLSASALAGVARFAVLRLAVFTHNRPRTAATARPAPAPRCSAPDSRRTAQTAAAAPYTAHRTSLRSAVGVHGCGHVRPAHKAEAVPARPPARLAARQGSAQYAPIQRRTASLTVSSRVLSASTACRSPGAGASPARTSAACSSRRRRSAAAIARGGPESGAACGASSSVPAWEGTRQSSSPHCPPVCAPFNAVCASKPQR